MVHPLLFLQFLSSKTAAPAAISDASANAVVYTWLVIILLLVLSTDCNQALKMIPSGTFRILWKWWSTALRT
jgi:F-type H+-transporting ATPase subunit a